MTTDDLIEGLGITVDSGEPKPLVREGLIIDGQPQLAFPSGKHRDKFVASCQEQVASRCQDGARCERMANERLIVLNLCLVSLIGGDLPGHAHNTGLLVP